MKYRKISENARKVYVKNDMSGGIGKAGAGDKERYIKESENIWHKDRVIKTRPALRCVDVDIPLGAVNSQKLTVTDTVCYKNGRKYNIAYYSTGDGEEYEHIYVYLVSDAENILPMGMISNSATVGNTLYSPESVFFLVGEKTEGTGVYAFVTLSASGEKKYAIYEAKDGNSEWEEVGNDQKYIPTVLLNGRGNQFADAQELFGYVFDNPQKPEQINLISPMFRAYYSSDGMSWGFYLPEQYIDSTNVECRIYFNEREYVEFSIPEASGDTKVYGGVVVTAYCDRDEGKVYFMSDGASWAPPRVPQFEKNNIVITASKTVPDGIEKIVGCRGVTVSNSRAYIYGNDVAPNEIYSCRLSNPLYFSKSAKASVGAPNQRIVAAGYQNDKVIVFKNGEIYKVNTSGGTASTVTVQGWGTELSLSDVLSSDTISTKTGCLSSGTVASDSGQLIWVGSDKKVYTLEATTYGSEKNIFELSERVNGLLSENLSTEEGVYAAAKDGYYFLFAGGKVFVCDCHITNMGHAARYGSLDNKSAAWYEWSVPHGNITGVKYCGDIAVCGVDPNGEYQYIAFFSDNSCDSIAKGTEDNTLVTEDKSIGVRIESEPCDMGYHGRKIFEKAEIVLKAESPVNAALLTDKGKYRVHIHNVKDTVCVPAGIFASPAERAAFSLKSEGKIEFYEARFVYRAVK